MIKEMTKLIKEATFVTICQYKARSTGTDRREQIYVCAFRNSLNMLIGLTQIHLIQFNLNSEIQLQMALEIESKNLQE
jgi:hypothetical protein